MKKFSLVLGMIFFICTVHAQPISYADGIIKTVMKTWPDSFAVKPGGKARWAYDQGVILKGVEAAWKLTGKGEYFNYIQHSMDYYVKDNGTIYDYKPDEYNIDHINNGKLLLRLYTVTGKEKYKKAADLLRKQLQTHPRTKGGNFWHKKIYPNQVWLDGLYMGQPFYAEYASLFNDTAAFTDIIHQFVTIENKTRDPKTGLLYHAWDESLQQQWANKVNGLSPHIWARAMGWYGMALVDALDYIPATYPNRNLLIQILKRYAEAVIAVQDKKDGLWFDLLDVTDDKRNYKEASASSMFVYTLLKGIRKGYLAPIYAQNAKKGYDGIIHTFIKNENNQTNLYGTVSVSGLGGNPYRSGTADYYFSEPVVMNDPKGVGAFIQCSVEMQMAMAPKIGSGKTVLLDRFFNNERRKDASGNNERWHYIWEEWDNGGFGLWGYQFELYGSTLVSLDDAPSPANLLKASVYIIVDPDHIKDNPSPHYINDQHANAITNWVKNGGRLVLMANDSSNCDLAHTNILAKKLGFEFSNLSVNMVKGSEYETGLVLPVPNNEIFKKDTRMYVKELSVLNIPNKKAVVAKTPDGRFDVMAAFSFGKGKVFVIGDPWLYNEYTDGRKLPVQFNNFEAMQVLTKWLLKK
ncbi:MAG: glycoside hydrolase family 88 protein [Sediminibacterium sp.]|nr:glycoside hydrolase family 88 protein [Sediminibacterium sp.]MBX9779040.1 glycoside hydrolase family 88 protein [Chitinophagaceae bacterium]